MLRKMFATVAITAMAIALTAGLASAAEFVPPSSNADNEANGWAHYSVDEIGIGYVDVTFIQPRNFFACFEYRSDGDTSQAIRATHELNDFNVQFTDLQYPYTCLSTAGQQESVRLYAGEYVEIRMMLGAEGDERFNWQDKIYVLPDAQTKDDCMNGGFAAYGFANQGQCIKFVNTGKDSR
ncbi:MAG: hypothetical protein AB7V46_25315 [Thermomicrobiales bacterium]